LAEIISIGTALPAYCHKQKDIIHFMSNVYGLDKTETRKLSFLYNHSSIEYRYSVIDDFSLPEEEWDFIPHDNGKHFPTVDDRMKIFDKEALPLSENLSLIAAAGLEAIEYIRKKNKANVYWLRERLLLIEKAKQQSGRCELQVVNPVEQLLRAAAVAEDTSEGKLAIN